MKITIKKIRHSESLSEETNAFTADLYVDNKKVAFCRNNGRGGSTFIDHYDGKKGKLFEAYDFADNMKPILYQGTSLPMDLEFYVDGLLEDFLLEKALKKDFRNGIVYENKNGEKSVISWKGWTIPKLMSSVVGKVAVTNKVSELTKQGFLVLNTNI